MNRRSLRLRGVAATAVALALGLAACTSGGDYPNTTVPTPTTTPAATAAPATPASCTNATQTYNPLPALPPPGDLSGTMAEIKARGKLRVGVSADSLLLGARNPLTGQIEGFDIDIATAVAGAIFGDTTNRVTLVVISSADRIKALQDKRVDIVARNMSMTCDRWKDIAFSAEYYHSGLKILVPKGSPVTTLEGLKGQRVCAPTGTTTLAQVQATPGLVAVGAATHTGCLVLFQNGEVTAIAGDDTVLAGLVAQDPYASVPKMQPATNEPYGLGINKDAVDLVRFVNTLLDQMKADGRWKAIYDRWFAASLGPAPTPPKSVYGR